MDFHQIRIFLEVARQKNFTRAAENLFLSQPTVSMHIKKLEDEIGCPLLIRDKDGLKLTESGKTLFDYGQRLLEIKSKALSTIQDEQRIVRGHLEIAASSVPGAYLLPRILRSFYTAYPEVTFSVLLRDTKQVLRSVKDCTYDLGFTGEPGNPEGLEQIKLTEDELVMVSSPNTAVPASGGSDTALPEVCLHDCVDLRFLLREPGSATREVFEEALKRLPGKAFRPNVIGHLESQEAIKEAVKTGLGVTVISRKAVADELEAALLKAYRLRGISLKRDFYMVFRKQSVLPALNKAFFEFTCDHFCVNRQHKT